MLSFLREAGIPSEHIVSITPEIVQMTFLTTNVFIALEDSITVIDTGFAATAPRIVDFVKAMGRAPEDIGLIVLTHCHPDHVRGLRKLKELTGARVACHKDDICDEGVPPLYPAAVQKALGLRSLSLIRAQLGIASGEVDIRFEGGETLAPLGGLRVIHTPGHTPGSICLLSPKYRLLFAGDTLVRTKNGLATARKAVSADPGLAAESVAKLGSEDFEILCFGHHLPITANARSMVLDLINATRAGEP